ncbi:MAG: hypothetical protein ABL859_04240, partial [Methylotenera sp.]
MADSDHFSDKEIQQNLKEFIQAVFGPKAPTLAEVIHFEGIGSLENNEAILELKMCKDKFQIIDPGNSKKCQMIITSRAMHPEQAESLYYKLLRQKLQVSPSMLKIESIKRTTETNGYNHIKITLSVSNRAEQLLLTHPDRRAVAAVTRARSALR